jgi:hypothetical protein
MYVLWSIPDSYIKMENQDNAEKIHALIRHMDACLREANAALYLYKNFDEKSDYMQGQIRIHFYLVAAKSFVMNIDLYFKSLKRISYIQNDGSITPLIEIFEKDFPDLKGVRDSIQHSDERTIKMAGRKEIFPEGGIMYSNNIRYDALEFTKEDGKPGHVEISINSLEHVKDNLLALCTKFDWG